MRWKTMLIVIIVIGMVGLAGCSGDLGDIGLDDTLDDETDTGDNGETSNASPWEPAFTTPSPHEMDAVQVYRQNHRNIEHKTDIAERDKEEMEERAAELKSDGFADDFGRVIRNGKSFEATAVIQANARSHNEDLLGPDGVEVTSHVVNYRYTGDYLYSAENTSRNPAAIESGAVRAVDLATDGHYAEEYSPVRNGGFPDTYIRYIDYNSGDSELAQSEVAYRNQYLYQTEMNAPYGDVHSPIQKILGEGDQFEYEGFTTEFPGAEGDRILHYTFDGLRVETLDKSWYQVMHHHGVVRENFNNFNTDDLEGDVFVNQAGEPVGISYSLQGIDSIGGTVLIDYKNESEMADVTQSDDWQTADNADHASPAWMSSKERLMDAGSASVMVTRDTYKELKTDFNREITGGYVFGPSYPRSAAQAGQFDFTMSPGDRMNVAYDDGVIAVSENGEPAIEHHDEGDIGPVVILDEDGTPVYWGVLR